MKVCIIGAGPAGNYTAYLLAKKGYDVHVFEEHPEIGLPFQCTGILTSYIEDIVDVSKVLKEKIETFKLSTFSKELELKVKPNVVLDRTGFDQMLAKMAEEAGAKYHLEHTYISNDDYEIVLKDKKNDKLIRRKFDVLIGADGPNSAVAKMNTFKGTRKFWVGVQARIQMKQDKVQVYPHIGVFAWIVPESKEVCRVGLYAKEKARVLFDEFIEKIGETKILDHQGGLIPEYNPDIQTEKKVGEKKIFLVGDAALQVKATTGGGIIPGMMAAECLAEAIETGKSYDKLWRKKIGLDLWLHLRIHKVLDKFKVKDWEYLLELMESEKAQKVMAEHDREYPSRFLWEMIKAQPKLLKFVRFLF